MTIHRAPLRRANPAAVAALIAAGILLAGPVLAFIVAMDAGVVKDSRRKHAVNITRQSQHSGRPQA